MNGHMNAIRCTRCELRLTERRADFHNPHLCVWCADYLTGIHRDADEAHRPTHPNEDAA